MAEISVHELLTGYRLAYESIKSTSGKNRRYETEAAYERLLDVENRTDNIQDAQIIMEKEHLVIHTITADYENIAKNFLEAVDPNYEVTSAAVNATIGVYATATSVEDITYMGEVSRSKTDDIAVQLQIKMEMFADLLAIFVGWEDSKKKIRAGLDPGALVKAMAVDRQKMREFYRFMSEDMGITWDDIENTPFYSISMLNPKGLDALWRVKKVMHPANLRAMRYVLFEEMLSDKSMKEILMTPQPYPFYAEIDTNRDPMLDAQYQKIAADLNKDIPYFQEMGGDVSDAGDLLGRVSGLRKGLGIAAMGQTSGMPGMAGMNPAGAAGALGAAASAVSGFFRRGRYAQKSPQYTAPQTQPQQSRTTGSAADAGHVQRQQSQQRQAPEGGNSAAKSVAREAAKEAAKDVGRGLLRGLFRR